MYSHGQKVDLSQIRVERIRIRDLRAHLKRLVDGDTVLLLWKAWQTRAIIIPCPPRKWCDSHEQRTRIAQLRRRFAAALAALAP